MNRQSPVTITLSLLGIMAAIAFISAVVGYKVGAIALEGVTQPEANPAQKFADGKYEREDPQAFRPVSEKTIINQVYNTIQRKSKVFKPEIAAEPDKSKEKGDSQQLDFAASPQPSSNKTQTLPLQSQAEGLLLKVNGVEQVSNSLVLAISLRNDGDRPRRFLYSFLELKDDRGEAISGIIEGLPEEIPANKQTFNGQIKIPRGLLQDDRRLALTLSDYPDQTITLSIKDIPLNP
jgi:hypothetical protein